MTASLKTFPLSTLALSVALCLGTGFVTSAVAATEATCARGTTCLSFSASTLYDPFEGLVSAGMVKDPVKANRPNNVAKFVKGPSGQPWAGATVYTNATDKSVKPIGLDKSKIITVRVYAAAAGQTIRLKVENSLDPTTSVETDATTTVGGAWETLTFDLGQPAPGTPAYNPAKTYNKISLFPQFSVTAPPAADTTTYFDDLVYTTKKGSGPQAPLVYAANYSQVDPVTWTSTQGGTAGNYIDTTVPSQYWWNGVAPGDATPSFYFGYGINVNQKPWGFGAFVNAPANGTVKVGGYTNMRIAVWGNDELMNHHPNLALLLVGPSISGCAAVLTSSVAVTAPGVQNYTVPISSFALTTPCGYASASAALAGGTASAHVQVLGSNMQFTAATDGNGNYANGLNIGPISFE
ncbi:hypothetical protein KAK07_12670 [Ideonella sp. 4Y16]|uniref:hypothetical protein n=1 Tax=Ideonella alba TaxID=2824118 RepID=UPI001B3772FA|nr:hypothetical protein [Ideonella alba]MBQ0944190.1 hypothetical protein [Ideonella alba]